MEDPLPVGLGLRVPLPTTTTSQSSNPFCIPVVSTPPKAINVAADGLCEFDELDLIQVRIDCYLLVKDCLTHLLDEGLHR